MLDRYRIISKICREKNKQLKLIRTLRKNANSRRDIFRFPVVITVKKHKSGKIASDSRKLNDSYMKNYETKYAKS